MTPEKPAIPPIEKKSMAEVLREKRIARETEDRLAAEAAAAEAAELQKQTEAREGGELKAQIAELDAKKKRLEDLIVKIKDARKGVDAAVGDFEKADEVIKKLMKDNEADLGVESRDQLLGTEQTAEERDGGKVTKKAEFKTNPEVNSEFKETSDFRERQQTLKEKIAAVLAEKGKVQEELPEADLTVESSKKEGKTNEESVVAKMNEAITELQKTIAELTEKTPEKIAERKNEAACKDYLENSAGFCRLPLRKGGMVGQLTADHLRSMPLFTYETGVMPAIAQFGEEAFKKSAFEIMLPNFEKVMQGNVKLTDASKVKLAEMLEAKIERDVLEQKLSELNREGDQRVLVEDRSRILQEAASARESLDRFGRFTASEGYGKLKDKRVKISDTRTDSYSRFGQGKLEVLDLDGENTNAPVVRARFEDADRKRQEVQKQIDGLKKPLLNFGDAGRRYQQRLDGLQDEYRRYDQRATEEKAKLDEYARDYRQNPTSNLLQISQFIESTNLKGNSILSPIETGIVENVMRKVEEKLNERATRKPNDALEKRVTAYLDMKDALENADREYQRKTVHYV